MLPLPEIIKWTNLIRHSYIVWNFARFSTTQYWPLCFFHVLRTISSSRLKIYPWQDATIWLRHWQWDHVWSRWWQHGVLLPQWGKPPSSILEKSKTPSTSSHSIWGSHRTPKAWAMRTFTTWWNASSTSSRDQSRKTTRHRPLSHGSFDYKENILSSSSFFFPKANHISSQSKCHL